jgi:hypothetical protein
MYQDTGTIRTLYDFEMQNGQVVNPHLIGRLGTDWQFAGVGDFNDDGTSDFAMTQTGVATWEFEVSGGHVTTAHPVQTGQLVQAMAGFGGGAAADTTSNTVPLGAETSQQTLLTTPHA